MEGDEHVAVAMRGKRMLQFLQFVGGDESAAALIAATPGSALDAFNALATRAALAS